MRYAGVRVISTSPFNDTKHLTPEGSRVVADYILRVLRVSHDSKNDAIH